MITVASWNTYCAPTMPGRRQRKQQILEELSCLKDADIILFQELNCLTGGPLAKFTFAKKKREEKHRHLMRFLEYLAVLEGKFFHSGRRQFFFDNYEDIKEKLSSFDFNHFEESAPSNGGLNEGLFIASKFKLHNVVKVPMDSDTVHAPGVIKVEFAFKRKTITLLNCHLLPSLPNTKISYRLTNLLNSLFRKNTVLIRAEQIKKICASLHQQPLIWGGDFNIHEHSEEFVFHFGQKNSIQRGKNISSHNYTCGNQKIDHILTSHHFKSNTYRIIQNETSDHNILIAQLKI